MAGGTVLLHGIGAIDREVYLKALRIVNQDRIAYIRRVGGGIVAVVKGDSGEVYRVSIVNGRPTCTCPYNSLRKRTCKHIVAVLIRLRAVLRRNLHPHTRASG